MGTSGFYVDIYRLTCVSLCESVSEFGCTLFSSLSCYEHREYILICFITISNSKALSSNFKTVAIYASLHAQKRSIGARQQLLYRLRGWSNYINLEPKTVRSFARKRYHKNVFTDVLIYII